MGKIIGYVSTKDLPAVTEEDVRALDIVNIAFGHLKDQKIVWNPGEASGEIERMHRIHPELKIVLSVGGWGAGGFSETARTPEGRAAMAESALELIRRYDLDGIDIDWEYPGSSLAGIASCPEDKENYTWMLKALREALDQSGKTCLLTIAAGGDSYFVKQTEMGKASEYLDYVQLMTYDLQGGFQMATGHHTSLYSSAGNLCDACVDKAVRVFAEAGVPKEKIVIGAAFYSRAWKVKEDLRTGLGVEASTVGGYGADYSTLKKDYIDKNGYKRYWDDEAKAPYLYNGTEFISYDDEESIGCKIDYLKEKGLCGIMYWEYQCDGTRTLTGYMRRKMDE